MLWRQESGTDASHQKGHEKRRIVPRYDFEHVCAKADVDYRTTKPKHPWANGKVEWMNRAIKNLSRT